jgi:hypothetical protein
VPTRACGGALERMATLIRRACTQRPVATHDPSGPWGEGKMHEGPRSQEVNQECVRGPSTEGVGERGEEEGVLQKKFRWPTHDR